MQVGRRKALQLLGVAAFIWSGFGVLGRRVARGLSLPPLGLRLVTTDDAIPLQLIMTSCVKDPAAFYGKCGVWSLAWANDFIRRCPQSPVLTLNGATVAFFEVPPMKPETPALAADASADEQEKFALRERNRKTFRATAAGILFDQFSPDDVVLLFRTVIYHGFKTARSLGYEYVEAWAPWEKHPMMPRKWTDYPGCEVTQPVARNLEGGNDLYFLRWNLEQAITALAGEARFDVA